ncbi:transcription termination factor MTERF15, mitochondrial-like isoform X2 [Corylus avellana]|uniref:transcription termination factor MTERF15, mitochondrial-like isoform X2 n=1 Tax=Corylus avellana TaxID=13451 RepID=UPI001E200A79|nr:transcription termination factor MTERF15, mitochondrial-like isoform X2 [Corylus avellana]XP_059435175.1 transcription termination factor MTERF15, mitochondrial-like isoform X2 [Corylus avellana]
MFGFLCSRQLVQLKYRRTQLGFLQQNGFFIVKSFTSVVSLPESSQKPEEEEKHSFAVSYLINSCGLSTKSAILKSRRLIFQSPERPDSVLNLFKENGISNAQISKIVRKYPLILLSDPEKTLLPKIEFLRSIGVSSSDLITIISSYPFLFRCNLRKRVIPCYDILKSVLLVDEKVLTTFKRAPRACLNDVTNNMAPNIALLRQLGAPSSTISFLVTNYPSAAFIKHTRFVEAVHQAMEMGFDPSKTVFVLAIQVLLKMKKPKLESRFELYKRWGWSKHMALAAFKSFPNCMQSSEEKITKTMEFLVNKIGWPSANIATYPYVINLSLEKRIIPRCSVVQILLAKGLIKNNLALGTFLLPTERKFLERFVIRFQDDVPELLNVYQGKMSSGCRISV